MKLIFENEISLCPSDSKTNVILPFMIKDGFKRIEICFSYTPKVLDDRNLSLKYIYDGLKKYAPGVYRSGYNSSETYLPVQNLLTLSLDGPAGYIGCAHRHAPEQKHVISDIFSSPGFICQNPGKGNWKAVINVHAVVTDPCTCQLKVFGLDESGID